LRRGYLESGQAVAKEDVDGTSPVNKHALEPDVVDARIQDKRETSWLRDGGPLVLPAEGDLPVRPGREFRIDDKTVGAVHVEAGSLQELSFSLRLNGNFASEDGVDHVSRIDILVSWVPILVVVFVFVTTPVLLPVVLRRIVLGSPPHVDVFKDTAFFHRVIGLGVELARSLQRFVVIFLVVPPPIGTLDCIHLVVVVARALAPEVITIVTPPIPTFSMVTVVRAMMVLVVERPRLSSRRGGWSGPLASSRMSFSASSASA